MFGSEVLDAAAIGAGAALLGGIIAGMFSYLTNLANLRAKRYEMAFEERRKAFQIICEAISETNSAIDRFFDIFVIDGKVDMDYMAGLHSGSFFVDFNHLVLVI